MLRNPEWLAKGAPAPRQCVSAWKPGDIMDCFFYHCAGCYFYLAVKRTNDAKRMLRVEIRDGLGLMLREGE